MRVRLIREETIRAFIVEHARSRSSFEEWLAALYIADWEKADDIKQTYGSSDLLGNGSSRVIFNIGGNKYRMICKYAFGDKMVHLFICWMGTHAEYDKLIDKNEQYTVSKY
jgi:mRNA interferase HigB